MSGAFRWRSLSRDGQGPYQAPNPVSGGFLEVRRHAAARRQTLAVRNWIARLLCVMLLLAGGLHAGHAHAGDSRADHGLTVAAFDLEGAASTSDQADAALDWCALAPGCAVGLADPRPAEGEVRVQAAVHPADTRLVTGLSGLAIPHPPRLLQV
jgi:hypothetical protein